MEQKNYSNRQQNTSPQTVNDLFDYDVGLDEILQEAPNTSNIRPSVVPYTSGLGLGLDEEVKVSKKRQPVAKLDETRLLSQTGIPKLRRTAKHKLKFKGKGHEFSDAARLLNFYQLWLDDLFPRAKFADGLAIIEKLGHHKRLQIMRREWIEEEKPKALTDNVEESSQTNQPTLPAATTAGDHVAVDAHLILHNNFGRDKLDQIRSSRRSDTPAQELQELFTPNARHKVNEDVPDDGDELENLLREQENEKTTNTSPSTSNELKLPVRGNDNDEFEAMEELDISNWV
ncbi:chromosome segregation in meiosis- protein [Aspergillus hancockii]|nr:chromosome segregation in meiosis- protein [Aspergillus hancockii]